MKACTRRAFVGFCAATALGCGLGGGAKLAGHDGTLLRPPGAQDPDAFLTACVKCDRCRSICPLGCIDTATLANSLLDARTPKLDMHRGYCNFCGKCARVCPTGAIRAGFDESTGKIGVAIVQADRCIAYDNACRVCADKCPYGAIRLSESGVPVVDAGSCNGCGLCENACPALAYRSFSGGTRRGIVVVTLDEFERLGATAVNGEEEGLDD